MVPNHVQTWFVTKAKKEIRYVNSMNVAKKCNGEYDVFSNRSNFKEFRGLGATFFVDLELRKFMIKSILPSCLYILLAPIMLRLKIP